MELNNRELAIVTWFVLALTYVVWKSRGIPASGAFMNLVRAFFQPRIQVVLLWATLWVVLCVQALRYINIWEVSNLKTTLIWGGAFAFVSIMSVNRIEEERTYFRTTLKETFNVTAIVAFIAEAYTFSLFIELLLVPLAFVVGAMHVLSERKTEHKAVHNLTTWVLVTIVVAYVANGTYSALSNLDEFWSWENLREFSVPLILSAMFLPYLYALSVIMTYEIVGSGITLLFKDRRALHRYAMFQALLSFRLGLEGLRRWKRNIGIFRPESKEQVRSSIKEVKTLMEREAHPPEIQPESGWCPFSARHLLADEGLTTEDYHRTYEDEWWSSSPVLPIDNGTGIRDNAVLFLRGDENAVKRLKLELNVFDKAGGAVSEPRFLSICRTLLRRAIGEPAAALLDCSGTDPQLDAVEAGRRIRFIKENYAHTNTGGYLLTLTIDHSADLSTSE